MNLTTPINATDAPLRSKEQACNAPIQPLFIGMFVFLLLVLLVTFIGNLLVILAVIFFRRLHTVTNYFIASLAVSDFLIALLSLPFRIHQNWNNSEWCLALELCKTWLVVDSICTYASIWNLAVISIDRFVAITRPYRYHSWITTRVGCGLILFVWSYSIFLALMMFLNWTTLGAPHFNINRECANMDRNYYTVVVSLSFFLPLMIITIMYGKVFQVAFNQKRELVALQVSVGGKIPRERTRKRSINLIRELKATKTLAVVVGCFLVCWFPFNVILMIILWKPKYFFSFSLEYRLGISLTFIYILPVLNSTMNPIIYALMNREFRLAFGNLARRLTGRRLGAVGGEETMLDTRTSRTGSTQTDHNIDQHGVRFSDNDSDCSPQPLPKAPQIGDIISSKSEFSSEQLKSVCSFEKTNHDTRTMFSPLEDDMNQNLHNDKTKSKQNGHVLTKDVAHTPEDDVNKSDNDVTEFKNDVIENVNALKDEESHVPALGNNSGPGIICKYSTLPPIESSGNLEVDNNGTVSTASAKRLRVSPSPDYSRKNFDDGSSLEITDNTLL